MTGSLECASFNGLDWTLIKTKDLRNAVEEKTGGYTIQLKTSAPATRSKHPFLHEVQTTLDLQLQFTNSTKKTVGMKSDEIWV